jgi:hypothetical protein
VRWAQLALVLFTLAGCNRNIDNKEAVRQGVVDYLATVAGLNISSMDVNVASVSFRNNQADAVVSFSPKGVNTRDGMTMRYTLEKKSGKWVVTHRADSGRNPHGLGANPHGMGSMTGGAPGGGDTMPDTQTSGGSGSEMPPGHPPLGSQTSPEKR